MNLKNHILLSMLLAMLLLLYYSVGLAPVIYASVTKQERVVVKKMESASDVITVNNELNPPTQQDAVAKNIVDDDIADIDVAGNKIVFVDNVKTMQANDLLDGMFIRTGGYYNVKDGGNGLYSIRAATASDIDDGGSIIILGNGNVAELITDGTVNVKQFGAKGDGVNIDTTAIQNAVNFAKFKVVFPQGTYKTGRIDITKNLEIDCQNSSFIAIQETLFDATGKVTETLLNQASYAANQADYILPDDTYTGYAMLAGTNNWEPQRTYYKAGMVGFFANGLFTDVIPIDVTTPTIKKINPITLTIKNINNVVFDVAGDTQHLWSIIKIYYGVDCVITNIQQTSELFSVVQLWYCYNCDVCNVNAILDDFTGSLPYNYPIRLSDSCFCDVYNSNIYNKKWHCISTGTGGELVDNGLSYHNHIHDCILQSAASYAVLDHENGIGTLVENCTASGIWVCAGGIVKNCTITSRNDTKHTCQLGIGATSLKSLSSYRIVNVVFMANENTTVPIRLMVTTYPQTAHNVVYYNDVRIVNLKNITRFGDTTKYYIDLVTNKNCDCIKYGQFVIDSCNFQMRLYKGNAKNFDFSNFEITYKNYKTKRYNDKKFLITMPHTGIVNLLNDDRSYIVATIIDMLYRIKMRLKVMTGCLTRYFELDSITFVI